MNLNFRSTSNMYAQNVRKFQQGGPMGPAPEDQGAPMPPEGGPAPEGGAPEGGGDQLAQIAQQLVDMLMQQVGDPQAVAQILETALDMVQGGGQQGAPEPQEGEPVYRMGGRLAYRIRK